MKGRLKFKIGRVRAFASVSLVGVLLLGFQNCAQPLCAEGDASCSGQTEGSSKEPSSSGGTKGNSSNNNPGNSNYAGGISMGSGGGGSNNGSGNSNTVGGISVGGGGSSGAGGNVGGAGGSSSGGGSGGGNNSFGFLAQPSNSMIFEGDSLELKIALTGGQAPYKIQWFKNNVEVNDGFGGYYTLPLSDATWKDAGTYYVEATDNTGARIRTSSFEVNVSERAVGCQAGSYFTYTNATFDTAYKYFSDYFDSTRGKYLLHRKYDHLNFLYTTGSNFSGLHTYSVPALTYKQRTTIACATAIPRIHSPTRNPGYNNDNDYRYTYTGNILLECRNDKLLFVSNTCQWQRR